MLQSHLQHYLMTCSEFSVTSQVQQQKMTVHPKRQQHGHVNTQKHTYMYVHDHTHTIHTYIGTKYKGCTYWHWPSYEFSAQFVITVARTSLNPTDLSNWQISSSWNNQQQIPNAAIHCWQQSRERTIQAWTDMIRYEYSSIHNGRYRYEYSLCRLRECNLYAMGGTLHTRLKCRPFATKQLLAVSFKTG